MAAASRSWERGYLSVLEHSLTTAPQVRSEDLGQPSPFLRVLTAWASRIPRKQTHAGVEATHLASSGIPGTHESAHGRSRDPDSHLRHFYVQISKFSKASSISNAAQERAQQVRTPVFQSVTDAQNQGPKIHSHHPQTRGSPPFNPRSGLFSLLLSSGSLIMEQSCCKAQPRSRSVTSREVN